MYRSGFRATLNFQKINGERGQENGERGTGNLEMENLETGTEIRNREPGRETGSEKDWSAVSTTKKSNFWTKK